MAELNNGSIFETVLWRNEGARQSDFPFRGQLIDGQKSTKIILCADTGDVEIGRQCRVRVTRITRPQNTRRGIIEVEYMGTVSLELNPDIYLDKTVSKKLQILLEAGYSIMLDGPQGSGKTVLSRAVAEALNMTYVYFNCSAVYEATDFVATLQVKAGTEGTVETVFVETDICRALVAAGENRRQKVLIFLDEFNRCRPMARNGLMPAMDSTRKIYNPATNSLIDISANVQFVAAINNGSQFVGASAVDPAQMDRFATIKLSYPPAAEEVRLLSRKFPMLDSSRINAVVETANVIREDFSLDADLSMRATEEACTLLGHPFFSDGVSAASAMLDCLETAFCGRFAGRINDVGTDANLVWQIIRREVGELSLDDLNADD
ncbi:MAG: AAA family ATPase [Pseudomonadota bacterium]